jgi:hypothetical protein
MGSGALMTVCVKNTAFWDATVCRLINMYPHLGGKSFFHLQRASGRYMALWKAQITTWTVHHVLARSKSAVIRRCDCLLSNFTLCNV